MSCNDHICLTTSIRIHFRKPSFLLEYFTESLTVKEIATIKPVLLLQFMTEMRETAFIMQNASQRYMRWATC